MQFAKFISTSVLFWLYLKMAASRSRRFTAAEVCRLLDAESDADGDDSDMEIALITLTKNTTH